MNDFERIKSDCFVTIANTFLKDKNLSNKAKGVLAMILALPDDWDFSIKGMVAVTKDGEASLRSAINEMRENGYCAMKPVRISNKIARWKYLFSGEKLSEKLLCDFLQVEKLNVENRAQYNKVSNINKYSIEKEDNNKSLSSKNKRFVKPSVEQIAEYIREKKLHFEAERFFDYYESKGWMIGKNHMKDWKAACRTWEAKRKSEIKEEEKEELPAGLTPETWALRQGWMYKFIPRIAERITPDMFLTLQGLSHFKPDVFKDIIEDIDKSDFNGDIVTEFDRLRFTENYASRIDL